MKRIYEPYAYGPEPAEACYWTTTTSCDPVPDLVGPHKTDVAIIGGGVTGLNAALRLAEGGAEVTVLDAEHPGWGASGRNGGFCCLGGSALDTQGITKHFGPDAAQDWHKTEITAVSHVKDLLDRLNIDADTHSKGETILAHKPARWRSLQDDAQNAADTYGIKPVLMTKQDLAAHGLNGPFYGGLTMPVGFALNPLKYTAGLARAATAAGATLFARSAVTRIEQSANFTLHTAQGTITAKRIIIATNGYSSEDIPNWLRARYMPVQSSIMVTRPLTGDELESAGWTSDQMAYDTRNLLHYFRLMPDKRFLFGMRGGIFATPREDAKIKHMIRRDFDLMFPAWRHVEAPHLWSGLVCMTGKLMPFIGEIPDMPNAFAALGYHGNGVAMGSYAGTLIADHLLAKPNRLPIPDYLAAPPSRFPLGSKRRWLLPPIYKAMQFKDR